MKITTPILAEYLEISLDLKRLKDRQDEIRAALIDQNFSGTDTFEVKISQSKSRRVAGLEKIFDKSPKLAEALEKAGLISETASTRVVVKLL